MDPEAAPDEKGLYWDSTPQWRNLGLDFFSQPSNIPAAASHSGGYGAFPRREANGMEGLDLNSEAANITGNMSYLDLLRSSPAGWAVEGGRGGDARGAVRSASRGAGRGAGRGGVRAAGRGASGGRVSGRAAAAGNRAATDHDIGVPSPTAGRGRGRGHTTPSRRPSTSVPQQFHPPRPAGGGLNTVGATDAANADFDSGLQDQELASYPWSQNPYDEEADDIQELDASSHNLFDKADWTNSANNTAFCELCVEEIKAGNSSKGHLTNRAYTNIAAKFEERTGLRHSKLQLKNRWDALRRMYSFWLSINKETGLGRRRGTVQADDDWWEKNTKGHGEWKKLRFGPPENLDELEVMFQNIAVDGSSSCIPGEQMTNTYEGDDSEDGDVGDGSPVSTHTGKRAGSTTTTATSPKKRTKSPMVKVMKGIWETMQKNCVVAQKALQGDFTFDSVQQCMRLAVECGAAEGSDEHWMACKLFVKSEHRAVFLSLTTNEARLEFLKRWCREKGSK
ncbi:unnamed protein product [Urochloa humidicola]